MKTVIIHEITNEVLSKDLSNFDIITFDDGLYSQYIHLDHFLKFGKPMHFFVSTHFVCPNGITQQKEAVYSGVAHDHARNGDFSYYMNWSQIREIHNTPNCQIGGHSHKHTRLSSLEENIADTNTMMAIFASNGITISSYSYPYNVPNPHRRHSVLAHGIADIFGQERVWVETGRPHKYLNYDD